VFKNALLAIVLGLSAYVVGAAGAATHLIRQVQDVSELKRAENELRESQRLHRLVLESAVGLALLAYFFWSASILWGR